MPALTPVHFILGRKPQFVLALAHSDPGPNKPSWNPNLRHLRPPWRGFPGGSSTCEAPALPPLSSWTHLQPPPWPYFLLLSQLCDCGIPKAGGGGARVCWNDPTTLTS